MIEPSDAEVEAFIEAHPGGGTLDEIAEVLGVTKQRIPQILNNAIRKVLRELKRHRIYHVSDVIPHRHYSSNHRDQLFG